MSNACNFCGSEKEDDILIKGIGDIHICSNCIKSSYKHIEEYEEFDEESEETDNKEDKKEKKNRITPKVLKEYLDAYAVGQDNSKKALSIAMYNHYKRINSEDEDIEIDKSNLMMIGPTGSGKTYLIKLMSKVLNVPYVITDCSQLSATGYRGDSVENMLEDLIRESDNDISKAETGIIVLDEIDKLSTQHDGDSSIGTRSVQQELLKIIEGTKKTINSVKTMDNEPVAIDTTNILFICSGAFVGLDEIVKKRKKSKIKKKSSIGFGADVEKKEIKVSMSEDVTHEDLIEYGMIPELIGRIPIITVLNKLTEEDLYKIIKDTRGSHLEQYQKLFKQDGIDLKFSDEAIKEIAKRAIETDTGARAIKSIMEDMLFDLMYEAPDENLKEISIHENNEIIKIKRPEENEGEISHEE